MQIFNVTEGAGNLIVHMSGDNSNYSVSYDHGKLIFSKEDRKYIIPEDNAKSIYFGRKDPAQKKLKYVFDNIRTLYRDTLPSDFGISDITDVTKNSSHFTNEITLGGVNDKVSLIFPNDVKAYVNGNLVASGTLVDNGDIIKFELIAPSEFDTSKDYNISIGDMNKSFVIRTEIGEMVSCKAWKEAGYNSDGIYKLNPTGNDSFDALCDMTNYDGGWTLVYMIADSSSMKSTNLVSSPSNLSSVVISDSYSGKLSDTTIRAIYTQQYRVEQWQTGVVFGKFNNINDYADNQKSTKKMGTSYSTIANYSSGSDTTWNYGFSSWNGTGHTILQLNYVDSRLGSHIQNNRSSGDSGCGTSGGCHSQVWVR